jgi:hypothetical protein
MSSSRVLSIYTDRSGLMDFFLVLVLWRSVLHRVSVMSSSRVLSIYTDRSGLMDFFLVLVL